MKRSNTPECQKNKCRTTRTDRYRDMPTYNRRTTKKTVVERINDKGSDDTKTVKSSTGETSIHTRGTTDYDFRDHLLRDQPLQELKMRTPLPDPRRNRRFIDFNLLDPPCKIWTKSEGPHINDHDPVVN